MVDGAMQRAYRPQLAQRSALEQRVIHCKRQTCLVAFPTARRHGTTRAQRVVEVGRVHLRALVRRACAQPRQRGAYTAPRLRQRAISGTVLQANSVEAVVERPNIHCSRGRAHRCVIDAPPSFAAGRHRSGAVHRQRGLNGLGLATANLEAAVKDRALDEQIGRLDGERLKEEDAVQCRSESSTRHLEVPRAWEDDAALHDVVSHDGVKLAFGGRTEDNAAVR